MKATVLLPKTQTLLEFDYAVGPTWVQHDLINGAYFKSGFRPTPTSISAASYSGGQIGEGINENGQAGGLITAGVALDTFTLAVPDEMLPTQKPRDMEMKMSYLTFYGAAGAGVAATRTSNTLVVGTGHPFLNGQIVTMATTGTLPGGLQTDTLYYVVSRTATAISLARTAGGSVITLSDAGTGTHQVVPFVEAAAIPYSLNPVFTNGTVTNLN
jgi:hypothetical protein